MPTMIARPKERRVSDLELHNRFAPLVRSYFVRQDKTIATLATTLGVTVAALDALHVGFDSQSWTFPEQNHAGLVVGINRRFPDGRKLCVIGSRRGLSYADDWADYSGPVFIVEGGSDVAAGLTLGLCIVGRPSNTGGGEYLYKLLETHTARRMIVLAERDEKPHETLSEKVKERHDPKCDGCGMCYPGKYGARLLSIRLSRKLNRIVEWDFLPDGAKDLRAWLNGRKADPNDERAMKRLAESLVRRLCRG